MSPKGKMIIAHSGNFNDLNARLLEAGLIAKPYNSKWSSASLALTTIFKADGRFTVEQIAAALMCALPCNQHITKLDAKKQRRAIERLLSHSYNPPLEAQGPSEDAIALRFAERHADELRYVAAWGHWMQWDGTRWNTDQTLRIFDLARIVVREAAAGLKNTRSMVNAKTVAAVERLAKSDRRIAATIHQWDADSWLLNTPGGVVDLRTGEMRPHQATDYMTKMTAVAPGGDCPLWRKFLQQIFDKDNELISYMQRVCGYALTGETREHALFFDYGVGANGKGTFLNTIGKILASYHVSSSIETFTVRGQDQHPTELAKLHGARLVTVAETEQGRRWAESRIKQLTGGDPVDARFMRQDFFTYYPQFKLMVSGNHKPQLRSTNEAIRRRINLIPFKVIIAPKERDQQLAEKLQAEWAGILVWMIKGCLEWQKKGLMPPKAVIDATADYLASEDVLGRWLEDYCIQDAQAWAGSTELFQSWQTWATANSEFIGSQTKFSTNLEERGFKKRRAESMGFIGLRLKPLKQEPELPLQQPQPSTANKILTVIYVRETDAAFLVAVNNNSDNEVWLPKSQVVVLETDGNTLKISVPLWLYLLPDKTRLREPKPEVPESEIPF